MRLPRVQKFGILSRAFSETITEFSLHASTYPLGTELTEQITEIVTGITVATVAFLINPEHREEEKVIFSETKLRITEKVRTIRRRITKK